MTARVLLWWDFKTWGGVIGGVGPAAPEPVCLMATRTAPPFFRKAHYKRSVIVADSDGAWIPHSRRQKENDNNITISGSDGILVPPWLSPPLQHTTSHCSHLREAVRAQPMCHNAETHFPDSFFFSPLCQNSTKAANCTFFFC